MFSSTLRKNSFAIFQSLRPNNTLFIAGNRFFGTHQKTPPQRDDAMKGMGPGNTQHVQLNEENILGQRVKGPGLDKGLNVQESSFTESTFTATQANKKEQKFTEESETTGNKGRNLYGNMNKTEHGHVGSNKGASNTSSEAGGKPKSHRH